MVSTALGFIMAMRVRDKGTTVRQGTEELLRIGSGMRPNSTAPIPFRGLVSADREYPMRGIVDDVMPDARWIATSKSHHGEQLVALLCAFVIM